MAADQPPSADETEPRRYPPGRIREAQENDISVLVAAKAVFTERGWSAPMSAVAERAGVGIGSLYRRYPSKEALGQALRVAAMDEISGIADDCVEHLPAPRVLEAFLDRYLDTSLGPLVASLGGHLTHPPEVIAAERRMHEALERLAGVGRGCGDLPRDYGPADLIFMIVQLRAAVPRDPATMTRFSRRWVKPLLTGLRAMAAAPGAETSDEPPPQWDEWMAVWSGDVPV
jgi:AcrR family transcriptional regulator